MTRPTEQEIRQDERRKVFQELADVAGGDEPEPLTIGRIRDMSEQEYLADKERVDDFLASYDPKAPAAPEWEEK